LKIKDEISLEAKSSLEKKIEINEQHLTIGFNSKEDAKLKIESDLYFAGKSHS
jgi:hypothetical protein